MVKRPPRIRTKSGNTRIHQFPDDVTLDELRISPSGNVVRFGSTHICGPGFLNAYEGVAFANRRGLVLNVALTLVWPLLNLKSPEVAMQENMDLLEGARKWLLSREVEVAYLYVHENGSLMDLHTNIQIHCPNRYKEDFRLWLGQRLNRNLDENINPFLKINGLRPAHCKLEDDQNTIAQWKRFRYNMKGLSRTEKLSDPTSGKRVGYEKLIHRHLRDADFVAAYKRVGLSRGIDTSSRKKFGFQSKFMTCDITNENLYTNEYLNLKTSEDVRRSLEGGL